MASPNVFFVTCPKGMEALLAGEVKNCGATATRETVAGVHFEGSLETAYRVCLWSRTASRVLLPLSTAPAPNAAALYEAARAVDWTTHFPRGGSLRVDFVGTSETLLNSHFSAQKVKDAVVDQLREKTGSRPSVDLENPAVRINARLQAGVVAIALDLSGESLHRRAYRVAGGEAPLKENLAAAVLLRSGWPEVARGGGPLVDPLCGSGTFLTEAALMAADAAPGLLRERFGFETWREHDDALWKALRQEARERRRQGVERGLPPIWGFDADPASVSAARESLRRLGVAGRFQVEGRELANLTCPAPADSPPGLVVTNPPYGERLGEAEALRHLYRHLGGKLREHFPGWRAALLTGNPDLGKTMGLRARKVYAFFNGPLACKLLCFDLRPEWFVGQDRESEAVAASRPTGQTPGRPASGKALPVPPPGSGEEMLANRLTKNLRVVGKWARRAGISCYRLYDADLKEYAFAVDRYGDHVVLQEYAPPGEVDPETARRRLAEGVQETARALGLSPEQVVVKQRRRQKPSDQYGKLGDQGRLISVEENGVRLLVNLSDYLDTGLFLDLRPLRLRIRELAAGKSFLNLFCYTAAATVHAAAGRAATTTSVDLSATYLDWARRNLALNGFSEKVHHVVRQDGPTFLDESRQRFDLILMDAPTFSNSKRLTQTFDVQRDHVELIRKAVRRLAPGGTIFFCTHSRRFRMDVNAMAELDLKDISRSTVPRDFARDPRVHQAWEIRRSPRAENGHPTPTGPAGEKKPPAPRPERRPRETEGTVRSERAYKAGEASKAGSRKKP